MWGKRYWGARYFASSYWPQSQGLAPVVTMTFYRMRPIVNMRLIPQIPGT